MKGQFSSVGVRSGDEDVLRPGTEVGPYRIAELIGSGGMGHVYRARDTRLPRDVAVKVLRPQDIGSADRRRRFEREARAISALAHPAIVTIYDVGVLEGPSGQPSTPYLAMELIDGRTLEDVLRYGAPLGLARCLELAIPLAQGLAAAHDVGVIHRDLKPSNIMVTESGQPKLLDFGLAKFEDSELASLASELATLTAEGTLLGTVGYMSPEQARGEPAKYASDQFSFGCVLYQMLTGRRAFVRNSAAETLSAILRDEPPALAVIAPSVPVPLRWIVARCLAKDPAERYASTVDLARDLIVLRERSAELLDRTPAEPVHRRGRSRFAGALTLGLALSAASSVVRDRFAPDPIGPQFRPLTFRSGFVGRALFTPGSNNIVYSASWDGQPLRTYQTMVDTVGFDRSLDSDPQFPLAYSADGSQVLVLLGVATSATILRGTLAWWPALGGRARPIMENVGWADWAARGQFLVVVRDAGGQRLLEAYDSGGRRLRELFRTSGAIAWVRLSPDEKRVAFVHYPSAYQARGEIWNVGADGSDARAISSAFGQCLGLEWRGSTGELIFTGSRQSSWANGLWALRQDGRPRLLMSLPEAFVLQSLSRDGRQALLLRSNETAQLLVRRQREPPMPLDWFGWSIVNDISPDRRSVLFYDGGAGAAAWGTWLRPLDGADAVRLGDGQMARFSPDGELVVNVAGDRGGPAQVQILPVGPGERRRLTEPPASHSWPSFADAKTLLFVRSESGKASVWRMAVDGSGARSLNADCEQPLAAPSGNRFACVGGNNRDRIDIYNLDDGVSRTFYQNQQPVRFRYLRWNTRGDALFAVTTDRRLLVFDAASGTLRTDEPLPAPGSSPYNRLLGAAVTDDATLQVYSVARYTSNLLLLSPLP